MFSPLNTSICGSAVLLLNLVAVHRKQRSRYIKLHLPPNFGWEVGWAPIHIMLAQTDLKLWKSSSQQMATCGGRSIVSAAAVIDFWEKNTNVKMFVINNHFKMLAINWKPFCKLSCLTNHPILVPVICPVPLREMQNVWSVPFKTHL